MNPLLSGLKPDEMVPCGRCGHESMFHMPVCFAVIVTGETLDDYIDCQCNHFTFKIGIYGWQS